jgi:hypothetical protein
MTAYENPRTIKTLSVPKSACSIREGQENIAVRETGCPTLGALPVLCVVVME